VLVPKHIKITEEEIKLVMEKHYIVTKSIFPVMNRDDPIARYLNLSSGDVCKIIRKSPTSGEYISYRVVK
jgi:DNA-directed RNA polymerase I, II, and III subunit RPABC1